MENQEERLESELDEQRSIDSAPDLEGDENSHIGGEELLDAEAVDMEMDEQELLAQKLEEAQEKAEQYLDGWQRARAEFANYKKRKDREQAELYQTIAGAVLKQYLDVVDDLELALRNRPKNGEGMEWAQGVELIYRKMLSILENEGVSPMKSEGVLFDPNLHEAISSEESQDFESGEVIEVVKHGYMIGEKVLRPAVVRVAR